jgi:DNA polymerase-3 subunit gamma/tau
VAPTPATKIETSRETVHPLTAPAEIAAAAASSLLISDTEHWLELVARSAVRGPVRLLAEHAGFVAHTNGVLQLSLSPGDEHLKSPSLVLQLGDAVATMLGGPVDLRFETSQVRGDTARARNAREREVKQAGAEQGFVTDPDIQRLVNVHGAQIVPDSIRPLGDS